MKDPDRAIASRSLPDRKSKASLSGDLGRARSSGRSGQIGVIAGGPGQMSVTASGRIVGLPANTSGHSSFSDRVTTTSRGLERARADRESFVNQSSVGQDMERRRIIEAHKERHSLRSNSGSVAQPQEAAEVDANDVKLNVSE